MQKHETAKHREYSLKLWKFHFLQQPLKNSNFILLSQSIRVAFKELQDVLRAFETKQKEIEQSYHMFSCHFMQNFLNVRTSETSPEENYISIFALKDIIIRVA